MDLQDLAVKLNARPCNDGYRARCPVHKDKHPSLWFGIKPKKDGSGEALYFMCKAGCDFNAIREAVGLNGTDIQVTGLVQPVRDPIVEEARRRRIQTAWDIANPIKLEDETPASIYLRHTRKVLKVGDKVPYVLREAASLRYYNAEGEHVGNFPAMIARLDAPDGTIATLHRTFLSPLGAKAPVDKPKKLMVSPYAGCTDGGAIRLAKPVDGVLGIAEGIETALACTKMFGIPTWAAWSASGLAKVVLPELTDLIIFADSDITGIKYANELKRRLETERVGLNIRVKLPSIKGHDFADQMLRMEKNV